VLFETIYGKEVEQVYTFLIEKGENYPVEELYNAFIPKNEEGRLLNTQNLERALSFLRSAKLIEGKSVLSALPLKCDDFKLSLLESLRSIELGVIRSGNKSDPYFLHLITKLYVEENRRYLSNEKLHKLANDLESDVSINRTVLGNWKAFMEYLGLGFRDTRGGFYCNVNDKVFINIISKWGKLEGTIQSFLEDHYNRFLPWKDAQGNLSEIVEEAMLGLVSKYAIRLESKQDLAAVSYFPQKYKWMVSLL